MAKYDTMVKRFVAKEKHINTEDKKMAKYEVRYEIHYSYLISEVEAESAEAAA